MMPVATTDLRGRIIAYREPSLCLLPGIDINRSSWATHFRAHPAGIDRIAQHSWPATRQRESESDDVQLAFGIGLCRVSNRARPIEVVQQP